MSDQPVRPGAVLAVVAVGGSAGSAARYGVALLLPHDAGTGVPWATLAVNSLGCLLIGVLVVVVEGRHPLLRPMLGIGVLGGFTTFSTFAVDAVVLADRGAVWTAAAYVAGTLVTALAAVSLGVFGTRRLLGRVV
ncbi:CrcB family protein [Dactylosporangium sp. NBC_01737]|uniref:fluoride efflux transporter FluC n=1 Tax=Dactylosporangium sp. NBC_01737 TaxID=2975959 RepID=UPI002E0E5A30|nr:CrcB family protein [Dactylosporangium sp. NBC_01737]